MICQGRLFVIVGLNLLLFGLSSALTGCGRNRLGWAEFPVSIYSDSALVQNADGKSDLKDAMTFWETKAGKKLFVYRGVWETKRGMPYRGNPTSPDSITANVIFFQNPWPFSSNVAAQTTVITSGGNEIQSAIIMVNPTLNFCSGDCSDEARAGWTTGESSARKTLAHELGHFLGLDHTDDISNIMYPDLQPGGSLDTVTIDTEGLKNAVGDSP